MTEKYVYLFSEGNAKMRSILGGKGANLAEMINLGLPVPQGFTISTKACTKYYEDGKKINSEVKSQVLGGINEIEKLTGKKFGGKKNPLLVSVRSGASVSMPGMMDTILNLGLNEEVVDTLAKRSHNPRWAWDSYRRFIQMYSEIVMGVSKAYFENIIDEMKREKGVKSDTKLDECDLRKLVQKFKKEYKAKIGKAFPDSPKDQLMGAIEAVFCSWDNPRANYYRLQNDIPYNIGTAVNVQMMTFGNMSETSGTGVAFTRNPATGEKKIMGEFLMNAQGEDVVAGVRTPMPILELKKILPKAYSDLISICHTLECHYKDMQDIEFTIENGKLFMLQTRNGKRTAQAALKIACDLVSEGMITKKQALMQIDPKSLDALLHPQFDENALKKLCPITKGIPASPGAACGKVVFTIKDAIEMGKNKEKVILVRLETSPEDIAGMHYSEGIVTVRGGMTSHAAVVARGMGTCCVCGCEDIKIDESLKFFTVNGKRYNKGDIISVDGSEGKVYEGAVKTIPANTKKGYFGKIMSWADKYSYLEVRTNAETSLDAKQAKDFGAKGIGLCRTEHMFFKPERINAMREVICASDFNERKRALSRLEPMQRRDFEELYTIMGNYPVTIRLLDPPLHEFLPAKKEDIELLAKTQNRKVEEIKNLILSLHEFNPMMGHRGCRLSVTYPEITKMQTRAIIKGAINVKAKHPSWHIMPEIMVPLVGEVKEFKFVKDIIKKTADEVIQKNKSRMKYKVGTMIEVPRAVLTADEIAKEAEFFSFGTNDLTQMTLGFSRDDVSKFLTDYFKNKIYEFDPFARLDEKGVGKLLSMAVKLGKSARKNLELGICGEQGGNPPSIEFFHKVGLDYVSCSPYRVPIARLACAQANIRFPRKK